MKVLHWHVHGSYSTALVQGPQTFLVPVDDARGTDGRGRARTWDWPANAVERTAAELAGERPDVVVLQRAHEVELCERWTGLRPGRDVPAIWLEHNAPQGRIAEMRHPAADHDGVHVVHVTHFNALFWDTGDRPTRVIEHGILDPGLRDVGELPRGAAVVNEAVRRGRVTGTDLLAPIGAGGPIDLFGIDAEALGGTDLPQHAMHDELARRRAYVHPVRWTSLGLSLLEAMHLGLPVVAVASTEVPDVVPPEAGCVSADPARLAAALEGFVQDRDAARAAGRHARAAVQERFALTRFLTDWKDVLEEVAA